MAAERKDDHWTVIVTTLIASMVVLVGAVVTALKPRIAHALPLYARQTGEPCATCHIAFPELTPTGRRFKLNGYTLTGGDSKLPPFAVMLQPAYTHTEAGQPGGAAPHFGPNNNLALQQVSLFTGGRITDHAGAFVQGTYDGVARRFAWDNTDIRYANTGSLFGEDLVWGATLNNNPTVQDVWNTTPAWRFPYISSALAPSPAASTLIEGAQAQKVAGAGGYAFWNDLVYVELSGYRALSKQTQTILGVDTTGESPISGTAPYWRVAVEPGWGNNHLEFGTFGLSADVIPQRQRGSGTDHVADIGLDAQYQYIGDRDAVTVRGSWIHESQSLGASRPLGLSSNGHELLRSFNASASYTYDRTWSLTGGYFLVSGSADAQLYGTPTGSPNSDGWITEVAYLPFSKGGPSFWPQLNARIGVQYIINDKFNGGRTNFDGMGRNASDNNTLFLYAWIAF
ncbi:MAG TPA: hypothetical protein VKQ29_06810 [Aliidongia sp.]|nr:hypothetical protein [Aliidongia sp.]